MERFLPADHRARTAVILWAYGYSHSEIAEIIGDGATARTVEGILRRFRRNAWERRQGEQE
jgi:transposase